MADEKHAANGAATPPDEGRTSPSTTSLEEQKSTKQPSIWRRAHEIITWTPPRCRWDPQKPPVFSMPLNVLFGFAGGFTVANLYYNHPILNILADEFNVPYEKVSQIPTVMQAGYAVGLLFLCPLGDLLKRRAFVCSLVLFTATMWIGLCITSSLPVFTAISFITAVTTVTPQLMLPLVGDLAPPIAALPPSQSSWRNVYWFSLGVQYVIFALLWLFMPDYPSTNPGGLNYFKMLWSILVMLTKHPVLVQACIIGFFTTSTFTCFWTTLTFLLAGEPYNYSPLVIGLFALIGIASMFLGPVYARVVIDRFVPLFSVILGEGICLIGVVIGTYTGSFTVAGPVIQAFFNDLGLQTSQIANRSAIYAIEPKARNRVNTAFMVATFCGQLVGTAAGNHLYARGGWIASGSYSVGSIGCALVVCAARGPWEPGWIGWGGGWNIKKKDANSADGKTAEAASHMAARPAADVEQAKVNAGTADDGLEELAGEDGENVMRKTRHGADEKKASALDDTVTEDAPRPSAATRS
ncbi:hypothetical protein B0A49_03325 [Cryomyces minteri]|nr:hypothetical protein B0A49_03325 [Cryomyces minteri]